MSSCTKLKHILIVESDSADSNSLLAALMSAGVRNPVVQVWDGHEAVNFLLGMHSRSTGAPPALVFLDVKLSDQSGHEVLEWIRKDCAGSDLITVVLTSADRPFDLKTACRLGADSFLVKPPTAEKLKKMASILNWHWLDFDGCARL